MRQGVAPVAALPGGGPVQTADTHYREGRRGRGGPTWHAVLEALIERSSTHLCVCVCVCVWVGVCVCEELNWEKHKAINSPCLNISGFQLITELVSKHIIGKVILRAIECIN